MEFHSSLSYINDSSCFQLMLGGFNRANDATVGDAFSNISSESRDLMQLNAPAVWEAMMYIHSVEIVDKCRTV